MFTADVDLSGSMYEFAWPSPGRNGALRACHGLDVPFTFVTPRGPLAAQLIGPEIPPHFAGLSAAMRNAAPAVGRVRPTSAHRIARKAYLSGIERV